MNMGSHGGVYLISLAFKFVGKIPSLLVTPYFQNNVLFILKLDLNWVKHPLDITKILKYCWGIYLQIPSLMKSAFD